MRDFVAEAKELMAQEYERFGAIQSAKTLRNGDPIWDDSYVLAAISSALEKANHYASEIERLRAELARIEENGTPWVPELLEWLEKHDCCPALPFTDYELIEALESRFGLLPPVARTRERARNILAGELAHDYPNIARSIVAGKSMEAYVMVPQALRAVETALKFREKGNV